MASGEVHELDAQSRLHIVSNNTSTQQSQIQKMRKVNFIALHSPGSIPIRSRLLPLRYKACGADSRSHDEAWLHDRGCVPSPFLPRSHISGTTLKLMCRAQDAQRCFLTLPTLHPCVVLFNVVWLLTPLCAVYEKHSFSVPVRHTDLLPLVLYLNQTSRRHLAALGGEEHGRPS
jgi:hypothetical protein